MRSSVNLTENGRDEDGLSTHINQKMSFKELFVIGVVVSKVYCDD
jgi:hypothetical protein